MSDDGHRTGCETDQLTAANQFSDGGGDYALDNIGKQDESPLSATQDACDIGGSGIAATRLVDIDVVSAGCQDSEVKASDQISGQNA